MLTQIITITVLSFIVFFIVNALGGLSVGFGYTAMHYTYKREKNPAFNLVFKIFTPILCTLICAIILHLLKFNSLNKNIWLVVVGSWAIRFLYNLFWDRISLTNWSMLLFQSVVSSCISYWLYLKISPNPSLLFPSSDNMLSELWLIVILFIYKAMDDFKLNEYKTTLRKNKYFNETFNSLKFKYGDLIKQTACNCDIEILAYAILVYENFNRPKIARTTERLFCKFKKQASYGIMQFKSSKPLTDYESILKGTTLLNELHQKVTTYTLARHTHSTWLNDAIIRRVAWHYNNSIEYSNEVLGLYQLIKDKHYTEQAPIDPNDKYDALFYSNYPIDIDPEILD